MRSSTAANPPSALGDGFTEELYRGVFGAIVSPDDEARDCRMVAAVTELQSLQPRTQLESMLAGQVVVTHHAAMDCFRRANNPALSDDIAVRLCKAGASLMRAMGDAMRSLERLQARPAPTPAAPVPEEPPPRDAPPEDPAPTSDPIERAMAGVIPPEPQPVPEALIRQRIARARQAIAATNGFGDWEAEPETDPFSVEALTATLRANQMRR